MDSMDSVTIIRIVAGLVAVATFLVVGIFYILTLSGALKRCSPIVRTMQPGAVWLLLVPFVNLIWHFFVVLALAQSLGNEFRVRKVPGVEPEPGKSIGIAMCICGVCAIIPILGILAGLAQLVLWIMYWSKIAGFSRMLDAAPVMSAPPYFTPGT
ncbi:MAG: hypothetical protein ABSE53_08435 [Terracidiphilus sp.]|jgi:hypothetical protein